MTLLKHVLVAVLALLLATGTALARPLTEAESRSLVEAVEAFDTAMRDRNYEIVAKTIPPRVMAHIAKSAGVEVDALRVLVIEQMKVALAEVKLVSFGMDLPKAEHRELPSGEPYVLVPTETVIDTGTDGKSVARSHTLALLDDGVWYLVRVSEARQVTIMRQVYPEFAGVEFPAGSVEAME
jgi:hypothetical protein